MHGCRLPAHGHAASGTAAVALVGRVGSVGVCHGRDVDHLPLLCPALHFDAISTCARLIGCSPLCSQESIWHWHTRGHGCTQEEGCEWEGAARLLLRGAGHKIERHAVAFKMIIAGGQIYKQALRCAWCVLLSFAGCGTCLVASSSCASRKKRQRQGRFRQGHSRRWRLQGAMAAIKLHVQGTWLRQGKWLHARAMQAATAGRHRWLASTAAALRGTGRTA